MNNITTGQDLAAKIEANRYDFFTFPKLEITVKYRKPDLLKLSINKSLPAAMAAAVIEAYKEAVGGADMAEYAKQAESKKLEPDDELVSDLSQKGYILLNNLVVSHKIMDVPESDVNAEPVPLISYNDVPEEDSIAFLMHLIQKAQEARTQSGGIVTSEDVTTFSNTKRSTKRRTSGKDG